jgi:hypothetical protein
MPMQAYDDTLDNACMLECPDAFCALSCGIRCLTVTLGGAEAEGKGTTACQ